MPPHPALKPLIRARFESGSSAPALSRETGVSPHTIYWWSSREKWTRTTPSLATVPRRAPPSAPAATQSDDLWFTRTWMAP